MQVADAWVDAGGPKSRAVEWVAIAEGESSFDTEAVSDVGALGLWQIMPFNFEPNGVSQSDWADPVSNALVAVRMSGHGTNCAAWDSCYTDIEASGRYEFLSYPQPGSADYNNIPGVSAALKGYAIGGPVPGEGDVKDPVPNLGAELAPSIKKLDLIFGSMVPTLARRQVALTMQANRMYRKNWHS
jgi:hypothetical protein